jgi:hypothetical protein
VKHLSHFPLPVAGEAAAAAATRTSIIGACRSSSSSSSSNKYIAQPVVLQFKPPFVQVQVSIALFLWWFFCLHVGSVSLFEFDLMTSSECWVSRLGIICSIRVGFVYAMNMKYSWGRVKQVGAMMACYNLQCRHVDSARKLRSHCS